MSSNQSSDVLTVAALGRPFTLGMLYDARKDELVPGYTLWDPAAMQEMTTESPTPSSNFQVTASDTIESQSFLLDIEASLKLSFLSGLIEVGGSAKYLNDHKTSKHQSRVTCEYHATTHFKQLAVTSLGPLDSHQLDTIQKGLATHVVTGIHYGANAVFVFDRGNVEESKVQEIQGKMEAVIKKIPKLGLEGGVELNLTAEEKALANTFSCKFYGDLLLESNPATFEEAVNTYVELPKLLGRNGEHAAPLKVWLMPLKQLDTKAAELICDVSAGLVRTMEDTLQDLRQVTMRCNDALADQVVQIFPDIGNAVSRFQKLCAYYAASLRQAVAKALPAIREGTRDESSLLKVFKDREQSPFSHDTLSKWLDGKEREINVVRSCLQMIGTDATVVQDQSELDREILSPSVTHALCFVFTSLETSDPVLDQMSKHLDSPLSRKVTNELWYFSSEVITSMRLKARAFRDMARGLKSNSSVKFFLMASANDKYRGASIYHYKDGFLLTDDFSKPQLPPVEQITDKSALMWYACDLTLDQNTLNNSLTLSQDNRRVTRGGTQKYPDLPERFDICAQVLCSEGLTGRCYWEAEWGFKEYIGVGVAYKQTPRKGGDACLGYNDSSWGFATLWLPVLLYPPPPHCFWYSYMISGDLQRLGVFLDWPGGTLSFYKVDGGSLTHLFTFTADFTGPVYPGFFIDSETGSVSLGPA